MTLTPDDADTFLTIWSCIDAFVCRRKAVLPGVETPAQIRTQPPDGIRRVRHALWADPSILEAFAKENPFGLSAADLELAAGFRHGVQGRFYVERMLKAHAVFVTATGDRVYLVVGVSHRIDTFLDHVRPVGYACMVDTVLLPHRGAIVWDGFPRVLNVSFGPGVRQQFKNAYLTAKERGELVGSLDRGARVAAARPKGTDWRPALAGLVGATETLGKPDTALQAASFRLVKQCALLAQGALQEPLDVDTLEHQIRAARRAPKQVEDSFGRVREG